MAGEANCTLMDISSPDCSTPCLIAPLIPVAAGMEGEDALPHPLHATWATSREEDGVWHRCSAWRAARSDRQAPTRSSWRGFPDDKIQRERGGGSGGAPRRELTRGGGDTPSSRGGGGGAPGLSEESDEPDSRRERRAMRGGG
jgi:hypothetical protein